MSDIDAELRLLLEERAILRTLYRYAHTMDYAREAEWVDVFTPDGIFDVVSVPSGETIHREDGAGDLAAYIAAYPKPPNFRKHIILNPVIELAGDTATVEAYWLFLGTDAGGSTWQAWGRYHDTLVKSGGEWKISKRYAETESSQHSMP